MNEMGIEISEDGKTVWRNNGGVIERKALYSADPTWETVAETTETPHTAEELEAFCKAGHFGYALPSGYAIAAIGNYYQPDIQRRGDPRFLCDPSGGKIATIYDDYDSASDALAELEDGVYVTEDGEAGRPEMLIVDADAVYAIENHKQDLGNYDWPEDCADWACADADGNVCGECVECLDLMAEQDEQIMRDYSM